MGIGTTLKSLGTQILSRAFGIKSNAPELPHTDAPKHKQGDVVLIRDPFSNRASVSIVGITKTVEIRGHLEQITPEFNLDRLQTYLESPDAWKKFLDSCDVPATLKGELISDPSKLQQGIEKIEAYNVEHPHQADVTVFEGSPP